ncbi:MAG: cytochrome c oxidase subunit 3 family protein [Myxococcales bacterium]
MSAEAAHAHGHGHNPHLAHHFGSMAQQNHAARMGMWLFLSTEILLFGGLFVAYAVYRYLYPETFRQASLHLDLTLGTVNTVVLITSSFTVVAAHYFANKNNSKMVGIMLLLSILMAFAFLGIKSIEYSHKFHEGALPGKFYTYTGLQLPGASMFFTIYFLTTGLHAFHVIIGIIVLTWLMVRAFRGDFGASYSTPIDLGGMYWHLVDLIWIYLYPLLYLI